jgi:hypothetical protein
MKTVRIQASGMQSVVDYYYHYHYNDDYDYGHCYGQINSLTRNDRSLNSSMCIHARINGILQMLP